jgi:hypothetical protein
MWWTRGSCADTLYDTVMMPSYSMDNVIIRNADPADAATIAELSGQLGYPVKEGVVRDRLLSLS